MPGHIDQQLRYAPQEHGGFYLSEPKAGSSGTVDLDPVVSQVLAEHVREFPPVAVELVDVTSGDPVRRSANHAEPQVGQRMLRHKTLRIGLETYVHWWPKRDRPRGMVGSVLRSALASQDQA